MTQFDINYFLNAEPNILENKNLRRAQITSYVELCRHFLIKKSNEHAVVILPTGTGKTGVMAIAPFGISKGRILIITPQLVIKDHVVDSLDSSSPNNFWLRHNIFNEYGDLPQIVEYDNDIQDEELYNSNIVIMNIHKISSRFRNSLLKKVKPDFFDMIIIDEAHHSPAETWQNALTYFSKSKVIKLTGTPFRTDRKPIKGDMIVNYRLGDAMRENIVKTLKKFTLINEKVLLTIDNDETKTYTIKELEVLQIKDNNYISRSVALSKECNQQLVNASIEQLNERLNNSSAPHKIIAVCCSIEHANKVKLLYEQAGKRVSIVHSKMKKKERKEELRKIESHQTDVVIHVAMLGEGYDHPYLSVAAIFRPFRSLAPYAQFIGRVLRRIPESEVESPLDNIGAVIAHKELGLEKLWAEYQEEMDYSDIIKSVVEKEEKKLEKTLRNPKNTEIGEVHIDGDLDISEEYYEYTLAAKEFEKYEEELKLKVNQLKAIFPNRSESELRKLAKIESPPKDLNPLLKNPKKYRAILREDLDKLVRFEIPANLITKFSLARNGTELYKLPVKNNYKWIFKNNPDNVAIIAKYLNAYLNNKYGDRKKWILKDYENAKKELPTIVEHLEKMIKSII